MMTFDLNPEPDSPRSARLDAQHVPGVLAVADASDGVGLLFGEAHADLGHRALPSILAHVGDGREERLWHKTRHYIDYECYFRGGLCMPALTWNISLMPSPLCADVSK